MSVNFQNVIHWIIALCIASFILPLKGFAQEGGEQIVFEQVITVMDAEERNEENVTSDYLPSPRSIDELEFEQAEFDDLQIEEEAYNTSVIESEDVQIEEEETGESQEIVDDLYIEEEVLNFEPVDAEDIQAEEEISNIEEFVLEEEDTEEEVETFQALEEGLDEEPNGLPNLQVYRPSGWSSSLVISDRRGNHLDSNVIYSDENIFIDWAVLNSGTASTSSRFYVKLYVDNVLKGNWYINAPFRRNYYAYVNDKYIGRLPVGSHSVKLVVDQSNRIPESNEIDNNVTRNISISGKGTANLSLYKPAGWSDRIVVSTSTGSHNQASTIYTDDNIYVDWAVINNGSAATDKIFYTKLYVDGIVKGTWYTYPPLNPYRYISVSDKYIGKLSRGSHTIKVVTDTSHVVSESDEADNEYSLVKYAAGTGSPNLMPYKPNGWNSQIVISNRTGTFSNAGTIYSNENIYVDLAIVNNGSNATDRRFYTRLYVDGVVKSTWYTNPPFRNRYYFYIKDKNIGKLSAGTHTFKVVTDATNTITETNEADNQYTASASITSSGASNCTAYNTLLRCVNAYSCDSDDNQTKQVGDVWYKKWGPIKNEKTCDAEDYRLKVKRCTRNNVNYSALVGKTGPSFDIRSGQTGYVRFNHRFAEAGIYRLEFSFIDKSGTEVPQGNLSPLTATVTVNGFRKPNLTPHRPGGWSDSIVVSNVTGTHSHAGAITSNQNVYVDWAVKNAGSAAVNSRFYTRLYVDNVLKGSWYTYSLNPGSYISVSDKYIGKLSAGRHTFKLVTDVYNNIVESSETDNQHITVRDIDSQGNANLAPYTPSGWTSPLVVSNVRGTHSDAATIYSNENVYIDWAVANTGSASVDKRFVTNLYVDNILKKTWYTNTNLRSNSYVHVQDYSIGRLTGGTHTLKIVTDVYNAVQESSEADNSYSKSKSVSARSDVNLTPYKPSNWSDKINVSNITGTFSDASTIYTSQNVYVDWAVLNNGNADISKYFYVKLYVDNQEKGSWYIPSLKKNYYVFRADKNIGTLSAGSHTIKVTADATNLISESNESDNIYQKSKRIGGSGTPDIRIEPTTISFNQSLASLYNLDLPISSVRLAEEDYLAGIEEGGSLAAECDIRHLRIITETIDTYDVIRLQGEEYELHADDIGDPLLPSRLVHVLVPPGSELANMQIDTVKQRRLDGTYNIVPNQPAIPTSQTPSGDMVSLREDLTDSAESFPASPVEFVEAVTMRGNNMFVFRVWPIQYIPKEKAVVVNDRFTWQFNAIPGVESLEYSMRVPMVEDVIAQMVVNTESLDEIASLSLQEGVESFSPDCEYLIITGNSLKSSFQLLLDHKKSQGLKAEIVTTESIYSRYSGADKQEKIKQCIRDYAVNHGTIWVLLGGDDTIVPDRNCYGNVNNEGSTDKTIPTDLYYAGLDDMNWNDDGDVTPCETYGDSVDLYPDVFIGRAPVRNVSDVNAFVSKTIAYANNPPAGDFAKKALMCGIKLWNTWSGKSDAHWRSDDMWARDMDPYWNGSIYRFYDTGTDFGGAGYNVTSSNLREQINKGYGLTFVATHGNQSIWAMEGHGYFYSSSASSCTNKDREGIIYTIACITNAFETEHPEYKGDPSLSEAFLRNSNGGAVGYIGSSRYGWGMGWSKVETGPSYNYARKFYKHLFNASSMQRGGGNDPDPSRYPRQLGAVHASHKIAYAGYSTSYGAYRWLQFALNLMGDPHLEILTGDPQGNSKSGFTIYNDGDADLVITSMTKRDNDAWLSFSPSASFTIPPGGSRLVTVTVDWTRVSAGTHQEQIIINSNDSGSSPYPNAVYVNATGSANRYNLNLSLEGEGKVMVNETPFYVPFNLSLASTDTVTLNATPQEGWKLDTWILDGQEVGGDQLQVQMNSERSILARFVEEVPEYTLTLAKDGTGDVKVNGILCQSYPCTQQIKENSSITLEAVPGDDFQLWLGSLEGADNPATIKMDGDKQITSVFRDGIPSEKWQAVIRAEGEMVDGVSFEEWQNQGEDETILVNVYTATIGVDSHAETVEAPPEPPKYSVLLDIMGANWNGYFLKDIRREGMPGYKWVIGINPHGNVPPEDSRSATLSWDPTQFSSTGTYRLKDENDNVVIEDMRTKTSYTVTGGNARQDYIIEYGNPYPDGEMNLSAGWNLISLPVIPDNPDLAVLFPDAEVAYKFDESYQQVFQLFPGRGYWVKVPYAGTYKISGRKFEGYTLNLAKGWHLVGAVDGSVQPVYSGIVDAIFGFTGSYFNTDTFIGGLGYWIHVDSAESEFTVKP